MLRIDPSPDLAIEVSFSSIPSTLLPAPSLLYNAMQVSTLVNDLPMARPSTVVGGFLCGHLVKTNVRVHVHIPTQIFLPNKATPRQYRRLESPILSSLFNRISRSRPRDRNLSLFPYSILSPTISMTHTPISV